MKHFVSSQAELDNIINTCQPGDIIYLGEGHFVLEKLPSDVTILGRGRYRTILKAQSFQFPGDGVYTMKDLQIGGNN
jgi:hypothetical protein